MGVGPIAEAGDDEKSAPAGCALLTLVHSYSHGFIRRLAVQAGIERSALCELLVPEHAAFFVYAANGGDFVLGLTGAFRNRNGRVFAGTRNIRSHMSA
jgi:hypothetical protein